VHQEVPVKVTAWVDEGIAPLVLALNELPGVQTLDSCQGSTQRPAHVFFAHRGDAKTAAAFAADLGAALAPHDDAADYTLTAEWRPGTDQPVFRLACPTAQADKLAAVLSLASVSGHGMCGTALRS
jgi:hypothetical protein